MQLDRSTARQGMRAPRRLSGQAVTGYLFIAPAIVLYLIFNIWPLIRGLLMAFTSYTFLKPESRWDFNGLDNLAQMLADRTFWNGLRITGSYGLPAMALIIGLSLLVALLISNVGRGASTYRWFVYLPAILPVAVTFLMFGELFNYKYGLINQILQGLGVGPAPNWLGDRRFVIPSLIGADVWRSLGLPTLLFLVGLYSINGELYEAAAIDGASSWARFWHITLPLLRPSFLLVIILNLGIFAVTEPMLLLTNGGPQNTSRTLGFYAYQLAFTLGGFRLGYAAMISLFVGLSSALLALLTYWTLRERPA